MRKKYSRKRLKKSKRLAKRRKSIEKEEGKWYCVVPYHILRGGMSIVTTKVWDDDDPFAEDGVLTLAATYLQDLGAEDIVIKTNADADTHWDRLKDLIFDGPLENIFPKTFFPFLYHKFKRVAIIEYTSPYSLCSELNNIFTENHGGFFKTAFEPRYSLWEKIGSL